MRNRAFAVGVLASVLATSAWTLAAEVNAAGDIPDTQAFVTYRVPGTYRVDVPEGWARTDRGSTVVFSDKLDAARISVLRAGPAPDGQEETTAAKRDGQAVLAVSLRSVTLPAGRAIVLTYTSSSPPNPITGKQVRLEDQRIVFHDRARTVRLTLSAPVGSDNADQWNRIARSFRWE